MDDRQQETQVGRWTVDLFAIETKKQKKKKKKKKKN